MSSADAPQLLHHFRGPAGTVTHVAFHPTQNRLASASADHSVQLWTFVPRLRCYRLAAHTAAVHAVAWSPDGEVLASASADRTARLWIPTLRGSSGELRGHTAAVRHVDFNPSGRKLCTASDDKTVKYWSVAQKRYICTYSGHTNWVRCAKIAADGQQIASCSDDRTVRVWDVRTGQTVHVHSETKGGSGRQLAWHPDDHCIAVALTNRRVKVYETRTRKLLQLYEFPDTGAGAEEAAVTSVSWHPSGKYLVVGSRTSETRVLDLMEGRPIYTMLGHEAAVQTCAFAPEGDRLATGGSDRQIMIWSFTAKHNGADEDAENRAAGLNVSGIEALASTVGPSGDEEGTNGGRAVDNSIMLNPRNLLSNYTDEEFEIEIKNGNALPVDYLNKELKPESAYNRLHDELDVVFEQIRELRALVEDIEWRVRTLEMSASDDEVDMEAVFEC